MKQEYVYIFLTKIFFKNQKSLKKTFDTSFEFKITLLFLLFFLLYYLKSVLLLLGLLKIIGVKNQLLIRFFTALKCDEIFVQDPVIPESRIFLVRYRRTYVLNNNTFVLLYCLYGDMSKYIKEKYLNSTQNYMNKNLEL